MARKHTGYVFILSAPSGAGKTSLAQALVEAVDDLAISVSHTTRPQRPGEKQGVHYHFVTEPEFQAMIKAGDFLEYAQVFGNYYGTLRGAVDHLLQQGRNVVFDIDWQGARAIKQKIPEATSIFILPPSREVLRERLVERGQDRDAIIHKRMGDAVSEMKHYGEFDYVVVNDEFDAALRDLRAIVQGRPESRRPLSIDIQALLHGH
ncbi:MAG: guanylate kinase [Acidiferrobacterales bacterium]